MWITRTSINNPVFATMMMVALCVLGLFSYNRLRVERINPTAQPGSRAIVLYISVANRDGALRGGMFAKGQIVIDKSTPAAVVPATAIREESGQHYVFTIEGDKLSRRKVKVGAAQELEGVVEVVSGLEKGMNVVSARVSGLKHGAAAKLKTSQAAAPARSGV